MATPEQLESIRWASTLEYDNTVDEANRVPIIEELKTSGLKDNQPLPRQWYNEQLYNIWQVCLAFQTDFDNLDIDLADLQAQIDANRADILTNQNTIDSNEAAQEVVNTDLQSQIDALQLSIFQTMFAVGDIWTTQTEDNPTTRFGFGVWEKIEGKFIASSSDIDPAFIGAGATGGSKSHSHTDTFSVASHTLTEAQVPTYVHNHEYRDRYFIENSTDAAMVAATFKENTPIGYNGGAGTDGSDTDNNQWLYYDSNTEDDSFGGGGSHSHGLNGSVTSTTTLPPYEVFHVWRRTA